MTRIARPTATIVAFDGLVVDSTPARAHAIAEAISAELVRLSASDVVPLLGGRSLDEGVEAALALGMQSCDAAADATIRDLAVLRARRSYSAIVAQGMPTRDGALDWLRERVASHGRLVLRADSARRDVEQLLALSGIESLIAFARCTDDMPRNLGMTSLENSWHAILRRVAAQGVEPADCQAFERETACADVARTFGAMVQETDALR